MAHLFNLLDLIKVFVFLCLLHFRWLLPSTIHKSTNESFTSRSFRAQHKRLPPMWLNRGKRRSVNNLNTYPLCRSRGAACFKYFPYFIYAVLLRSKYRTSFLFGQRKTRACCCISLSLSISILYPLNFWSPTEREAFFFCFCFSLSLSLSLSISLSISLS